MPTQLTSPVEQLAYAATVRPYDPARDEAAYDDVLRHELASVRAQLVESLLHEPDAFAIREELWIEHEDLLRERDTPRGHVSTVDTLQIGDRVRLELAGFDVWWPVTEIVRHGASCTLAIEPDLPHRVIEGLVLARHALVLRAPRPGEAQRGWVDPDAE